MYSNDTYCSIFLFANAKDIRQTVASADCVINSFKSKFKEKYQRLLARSRARAFRPPPKTVRHRKGASEALLSGARGRNAANKSGGEKRLWPLCVTLCSQAEAHPCVGNPEMGKPSQKRSRLEGDRGTAHPPTIIDDQALGSLLKSRNRRTGHGAARPVAATLETA